MTLLSWPVVEYYRGMHYDCFQTMLLIIVEATNLFFKHTLYRCVFHISYICALLIYGLFLYIFGKLLLYSIALYYTNTGAGRRSIILTETLTQYTALHVQHRAIVLRVTPPPTPLTLYWWAHSNSD